MALPEAPMTIELIGHRREEVVQPTITVTVVSTPPMVQHQSAPPMIMVEIPDPVRVVEAPIPDPVRAVEVPIPEPIRVEPTRTYIDENRHIRRTSYKSSIVEHYKWTIGLLPRPEDENQKHKVDPRIAWGSSNYDHI